MITACIRNNYRHATLQDGVQLYIMARKSTIKLLLVNESDNEGERIVSLFRNAGRVARTHRVVSAEALLSLLQNDRWDLLISDDKHPELSAETCLKQLNKAKADIPVIVIRDNNNDIQAAIDAGAADVISPNDDHRLTFAAFRELENLECRRQLVLIKNQLNEAEQRCKLLLVESQDAIAYVSDGMLISANSHFAERFGYSEDELDCLPIIDLIADSDHEKFKSLLKTQLTSDESTHFGFTGCKDGGDEFGAEMQLSSSSVDGEQCVQITIRDSGSGSSDSNKNSYDTTTGLFNHEHFLHQLDTNIKQVNDGTTNCSLLFIGIDNFNDFRARLGISNTEDIVLNLAKFIQSQTTQEHCLAHYCDDGFSLLLPETDAQKATQYAEQLCRLVESHIIEVHQQSIQCTISIGIVDINAQSHDDPKQQIDHAFSGCKTVRENGTGNGVSLFVPEKQKRALGDANSDEELDAALSEAIDDGQFQLQFQPIVSLRGSAGDYYEVQVLMNNDDGSTSSIDEFSSRLKFNTVNTRLDRWVILEATKALATGRNNGQDIRLFMNLSRQALLDESLVPWLSVALKAGNIPAQALVLQFKEQDVANNLKPAISFSQALIETGCELSITDFGEVNDPFKNIKHIDARFTKLTSSFAEQIDSGDKSQALKTMVSSIKENDAKAIIPHIQHASALAVLWQIGADYIQGDYLAPPSSQMDYEFTDIA